MDPLTIIGAASAILSFVQFAGKVISTTIAIHNHAGQAFESNQELDRTVKEFNSKLAVLQLEMKLLLGASQGAYAHAMTRMSQSARKCELLGCEVQKMLEKIGILKPQQTEPERTEPDQTEPSVTKSRMRKFHLRRKKDEADQPAQRENPSIFQDFKTGTRAVWFKEKMDSLQAQYESCVKDFYNDFDTLDAQIRFQAIQKAVDSTATSLGALQSDFRDLAKDFKNANLKALGSLVEDYNKSNSITAKEERNRQYVLKLVRFENINKREIDIEDAAGDTFEWLLSDHRKPDYPGAPNISLLQWIRTGKGVYHITGKPGSGKSTLMKLIGRKLQSCLDGDAQQFVIASFFVWKMANAHPLQNRIEGMHRTLLHQILTQKPDLISAVFPEKWHPDRFGVGSSIPEVELRPDEIKDAVNRIFESSTPTYRFFLLIDGLDEFDDEKYRHLKIAEQIQQWCVRHPENIKALVSSREDNPFSKTFLVQQRLRLHLVTKEDIRQLTKQRLEEHFHFRSTEFDDQQRDDIINSITDKAEGVFLWAVLTIRQLAVELDSEQGYNVLCDAIKDYNKDLETFFKEILSRIPNRRRGEARALFEIVQFTTQRPEHNLCLFHIFRAATYTGESHHSTKPDDHQVSHEDANEQLKEFKSRIPTVTRGLLEITEPSERLETSALAGSEALYHLSFIHRSVFDFFQSNPKDIWADDGAGKHLDVLHRILESSVIIADTLAWHRPRWEVRRRSLDDWFYSEFWSLHQPENHWSIVVANLLHWAAEQNNGEEAAESYFGSLKALDNALLRKQGALPENMQLDSSQWSDLRLPEDTVKKLVSVFITACTENTQDSSYWQYISWAVKGQYPDWVRSSEWKTRIASDVYFGHDPFSNIPCLLDCNPDFIGINEELEVESLRHRYPSVHGSMWLNFLLWILHKYVIRESPGLLIESPWTNLTRAILDETVDELRKLLALGAEPHILFRWWSGSTNTQDNDSHESDEEASPDLERGNSSSSSSSVTTNAEDDHIWEWENGTICADDIPEGYEPWFQDIPDDMDLGDDFGLEIIEGLDSTLHLMQAESTDSKARIVRLFIHNLETPNGTASLRDVLNGIFSIHFGHFDSLYEWRGRITRRNQLLEDFDKALGQDAAQGARLASRDELEIQKPQHTPESEMTEFDERKVPSLVTEDRDIRVPLLSFERLRRDSKTLFFLGLGILLAITVKVCLNRIDAHSWLA